jgi:hypothetical protein
MGTLNPRWLSIELEMISATVENWSAAVRNSYDAALQASLKQEKLDSAELLELRTASGMA